MAADHLQQAICHQGFPSYGHMWIVDHLRQATLCYW
jgi:hypothetical protein